MYCVNCGFEIENESRFCPACGSRIKNYIGNYRLIEKEFFWDAPTSNKKALREVNNWLRCKRILIKELCMNTRPASEPTLIYMNIKYYESAVGSVYQLDYFSSYRWMGHDFSELETKLKKWEEENPEMELVFKQRRGYSHTDNLFIKLNAWYEDTGNTMALFIGYKTPWEPLPERMEVHLKSEWFDELVRGKEILIESKKEYDQKKDGKRIEYYDRTGGLVKCEEYKVDGMPKRITLFSMKQTTEAVQVYTYDEKERLIRISRYKGYKTSSSLFDEENYDYDALGNMILIDRACGA